MPRDTDTTDKSYFRKQDNNLYFSIPSNDKQRKTFLGLDGAGFWYLVLALMPVLIITIISIYMVQFRGLEMNAKVTVFLLFLLVSYVSIAWALCSHDSNTGKQTFSVLYQMIKYRFFQPQMIRPKFANRKKTIVTVKVATNDETIEEEKQTINGADIYNRRAEIRERENRT
ncbi:hypothetical protein [Staphylococcus xylosus]|uniref:hypothetical protein n=1 Tax=Staphylococcus xylosus TaxID=1288 RepID=UPI00403E4AAD